VTVPDATAVWTCALRAFWGLLRVSETTTRTQRSFVAELHASRAHVKGTVENGLSALALTLPRTKTSNSGAVVSVPSRSTLCPVRARRAHVVLSPAPASSYLFSYRTSGELVLLSCSVLLTRLGQAATAAGLLILNGHWYRIGG
ncbi:hypothetical protein V8E36_007958, partial [Tilletia maclaganii]